MQEYSISIDPSGFEFFFRYGPFYRDYCWHWPWGGVMTTEDVQW